MINRETVQFVSRDVYHSAKSNKDYHSVFAVIEGDDKQQKFDCDEALFQACGNVKMGDKLAVDMAVEPDYDGHASVRLLKPTK